jgi:hypothetical protein
MQLLQFFAGVLRCRNVKCDLHLLFNDAIVGEKLAVSIPTPPNE